MNDVYKELWDFNKICSRLEKIWESIWRDRNVKLEDKEKVCIERLFGKVLEEYSKFSYIFSLKLLKIWKEHLEEINEFSRRKLVKVANRKEYYPEFSNELITNIYKKLLNLQFSLNSVIKTFIPQSSQKYLLLLEIGFILKKPLITRDDEEFYLIDNPICKDKVFKIPMVRASLWKGALRYAAMRYVLEGNDNEKVERRLIMLRLFGTEKDKIEEYLDKIFGEGLKKRYKEEVKKIYRTENPQLRGRFIFFPTFFDQIGLDVIAPHDRRTRTVKNPILIEVVPENTIGKFYLGYFPFNLLEKLYSEDKKKEALKEIKEDWEFLKEIIPTMLEVYGFGAKTSSGYGIAELKEILINDKNCKNDWNTVSRVVENEYGR